MIERANASARCYRDLAALFTADAGDLETIPELKLLLIRRAAALTVECERLESELAAGHDVDVDGLALVSRHLRRIAESIGLDRVKRDVTPLLAELVAQHRSTPAL